MADNTQLSTNSGTGDLLATKEVSHGGDLTAKLQAVSIMGVSGTEGAYTVADINGDATNGLDVDVTRLPALPAGTNNIGDVDILSIAAGDNNIGNVDVVTLPALPAGTNNIGDVDVLSVVPGTSATSLGKAEDAAHTTADTGVLALAVRRDTAAVGSDTDGDYSTLNVDASGRLHVNVGNTVTVGSHAVTNAGTFAVQVDGSALTALQVIDNPVLVDDAAFTPATSSVMMAGYQADEASTDSVDEGDAGAARMTLDRKVITNPQPHTTGGLTIFRSLDLDETEEEVKATAGQVYGWYIANLATTTRFVKFYNATAANTTVGTTTPVLTLPIPGNGTDDVAANALGGMGIVFDTAITVAATSALADNDTTAPGANDVVINLFYK